jgi:hypothetical protein
MTPHTEPDAAVELVAERAYPAHATAAIQDLLDELTGTFPSAHERMTAELAERAERKEKH